MKLLLLLFITLLSFTAIGQEINCRKLKRGHFKDQDAEIYIKRKCNKQIVEMREYQTKYVLAIKWIDECTYTQKLKKYIKTSRKIRLVNLDRTVEIIEINADSYIQRETVDNNQSQYTIEQEILILK